MNRKKIVVIGLAVAVVCAVLAFGAAILIPDAHDSAASDHSVGAMAAIVACCAAVVAASSRRRSEKSGKDGQDD